MAEVVSDLMLEILKQIQSDTRATRHSVAELKVEVAALRGHFLAMSTDIANIYVRLGHFEDRMDRVEKRLGLVDVDLN